MENKGLVPIIAAAVLGYILLSPFLGKIDTNFSANTGEGFPSMPSNPKVQAAVESVKPILSGMTVDERLALARLWRDDAKVIGWDNSVLKSTSDIRAGNNANNTLMNLQLGKKYPALPTALDSALIAVLGKQPRDLDATTRKDAKEFFEALSAIAR